MGQIQEKAIGEAENKFDIPVGNCIFDLDDDGIVDFCFGQDGDFKPTQDDIDNYEAVRADFEAEAQKFEEIGIELEGVVNVDELTDRIKDIIEDITDVIQDLMDDLYFPQ